MAAVPLFNQYSLCTPPPPRLIALSVAKSQQNPSLHTHLLPYKPILGVSRSLPISSSPVPNRRSVRSFCVVKDAAVETSGADEESLSSFNSLLLYYKEAILNGDEETVSDIEATLCDIENQKNKLLEKTTALSSESGSLREKFIRLQADFDNFRKRSESERLTLKNNAQGEVIESLLPMVDNFERAKQQLKIETEQEKKIDASYQGIYKQFVEIMRSLRVAAVPTVGKSFDPSVHEAIAREESKEFGEGIIIEEFRRGFVLGERLLRPAMVKVSAGPGPVPGRAESNVVHSQESTQDSNEHPQAAGLGQR